MTHEKRLIDANELRNHKFPSIDSLYDDGWNDAIDAITENAPTVDAIVPPVKIGQILWCILPHSDTPFECRVYCISREERQGLVLDYFRCVVKGYFAKAFGFEDVGKTIFLTKTEALAKMDGGNEDG